MIHGENSARLGVEAIVGLAADEYGMTKQELTDRNLTSAWRQKIRRALKAGDAWNPVTQRYEVDESAARELLYDLRAYFYKSLGLTPAQIAEREGDAERLRTKLANERDARENYDWDEERRQIEQDLRTPDDSISDADFDRMMLRALFHASFPGFDEAAFRSDFEERNYIRGVLQYPDPDSNEDLRLARRYEVLDNKIRPAVERGDLRAYESRSTRDDRRGQTE